MFRQQPLRGGLANHISLIGKYKVFGVPRSFIRLGYIESILHTEIIELISDMTRSHQTYHGNGYQRRIQTFVIIFPNRRNFPALISAR